MPRHKTRRSRLRKNAQQGIAAIEVVVTTGLMIPSLALLLILGFKTCRNFFSVVGSMVGCPF